MNIVESVFLQTLNSIVGKLFLAVLSVGVIFLAITFLPEVIGLVIVGTMIVLGLHYFSKKI